NPYFFLTMARESDALVSLAAELPSLARCRQIVLTDTDQKRIVAQLNLPGSVYHALRGIEERAISYLELTRSHAPVPGLAHELEVLRFQFERKPHDLVAQGGDQVPDRLRRAVVGAMKTLYSAYDPGDLRPSLATLWRNDEEYVRHSPPERVARALWLYQQGRRNEGLFLEVENPDALARHGESRILFAVGNPPQLDFLTQSLEVFHRLGVGISRAYCLNISTGVHPYFLGTFYVRTRDGHRIERDSPLFGRLKAELYNTQILSTASPTYGAFVGQGIMGGEDASLTDAFIAFCHTNLAHAQPDRYDLEEVKRALTAHPEITLRLVGLFRARFDPAIEDRTAAYAAAGSDVETAVEGYNTGHRYLDEVRRAVFRCALAFIRHTLKTNFFVPEKHALAFRLDPAYLAALGPEFTADLPPDRPFRVTFFFGRHGVGYHVGFSDIARGGWRTVFCPTRDDFVTNTNTLLREVFVLAHTQHLKNKDIYEGGSKLVVALDTGGLPSAEAVRQRLYKLQYGFTNAFLDLFVTRNGRATDPRVVDYYGVDDPIELGPDENMHDSMIETIARQSVRRGYLLGIGIMSSKEAGINHKQYGVTSTGVVKFAAVALAERGIDLRRDPFSVKLTGGPNGDVAGNALKLLLARCPGVRIRLIVDGTGALYDPDGADREELSRIVLRDDLDAFDPARLHPGGFLLYRGRRRQEGLRELYRRVERRHGGVEERWVTADEFHREFAGLPFTVPADLFLPCGGRPETVDGHNWPSYFRVDGTPSAPVIVEGANSFITPPARAELQMRGVVILRDASANKCGVISSSYEIIANLLMTEREFLAHKEEYVADVLGILERRAEDEARLIFRRHRDAGGRVPFTEISDALSGEINAHYARLFEFFQARPELAREPVFHQALLAHLPRFVHDHRRYRQRVKGLPVKIRHAMLAAELATRIVYRGGWDADFESRLRAYLRGPAP
ncbi:MAG: NAD-glutamate dehydrogenase domain-containing protein, partial [Deferrisomatales bacterium]